MRRQVRQTIAFGPKAPFVDAFNPTPPVTFFPKREAWGAGETKTSEGIWIAYGEYFSISANWYGVAAPNYDIEFELLTDRDSEVDPASGGILNPTWDTVNPVPVVAAGTNGNAQFPFTPVLSEAIRLNVTNNAGAVIPAAPTAADPNGVGVLITVNVWS